MSPVLWMAQTHGFVYNLYWSACDASGDISVCHLTNEGINNISRTALRVTSSAFDRFIWIKLSSSYHIWDIDLDHFSLTIGDLPVVASVDQYNAVFTCILDEITPLKKRVSFNRSAPWYTSELRRMKAKGRQLEWILKKIWSNSS